MILEIPFNYATSLWKTESYSKNTMQTQCQRLSYVQIINQDFAKLGSFAKLLQVSEFRHAQQILCPSEINWLKLQDHV